MLANGRLPTLSYDFYQSINQHPINNKEMMTCNLKLTYRHTQGLLEIHGGYEQREKIKQTVSYPPHEFLKQSTIIPNLQKTKI